MKGRERETEGECSSVACRLNINVSTHDLNEF